MWVRIVAIIAILIGSYLVYEHYRSTPSKFCTFGDSFNCDVVNKSPYANLDGVLYFLHMDIGWDWVPLWTFELPAAIMGIATFLWIILSSFKIQQKKPLLGIPPKKQITVLKWLMVISIIFALYLVYIEKYVLLMWCIYCLSLDLVIVIEAILIKGLK